MASSLPTSDQQRLADVGEQVAAMQALLVRVLQDVVRAEARLERSQAGTMVAVNQQLLLAALASRADAEASQLASRQAGEAAMHDELTQLPNRSALLERFAQATANARRHSHCCAILFFDMNGFKQINDLHGHQVGDQALRLVGQRLSAAVRDVDTVSRHGGDEFVVLLGELAHRNDADKVAQKLRAAISLPAQVCGLAIQLSASAGVAVFPDNGEDPQSLIAFADADMYARKRNHPGRNDVAVPADAVARRMNELRQANEKLVLCALDAQRLAEGAEQARQRQAALLASVVTELRDPQAPIRIATRMLGMPRTDEPLLPVVQGLLDQQMRLVADLVDAVGTGSSGLALQQQRLDVADLTRHSLHTYQPVLDRRAQHLRCHFPAQALEVLGDPVALEQAIGNLVDNASRYTPEGGHIELTLQVHQHTVSLTIQDDGIGIAPALLTQVFDPFVQDPRVLGTEGVGLGVGLTVTRAVLRAHGGDIEAHSAGVGKGSQLVVTLPLAGCVRETEGAAS